MGSAEIITSVQLRRRWQKFRNNKNAKGNWKFTAEGASIKLSRFYPTLES
jgi:hypothetical protein